MYLCVLNIGLIYTYTVVIKIKHTVHGYINYI